MSVAEKSKSYRAVIQECIEALGKEHNPSAQHQQLLDVVTEGHKILWFCEALYFVDESKDSALSLLRDWLRVHDDGVDQAVQSYLDGGDDTQFWQVVSRLAAIGRRDDATELVQTRIQNVDSRAMGAAALGDASSSEPIYVAEAALLDAPPDTAEARLDGQFRVWQEECIATLEALEVKSGDDHLGLLLGVLGGQPSALQKSCRSWEELFVAGYLYTRLGGDPADRRKRSFEIASAFQPTHKALLALADSNPPEAIVVLARPGEYFYSAHLADLRSDSVELLLTNSFSEHQLDLYMVPANDQKSLRDYFVSEYALSLETLRGTVQLSADYLLSCGSRGEEILTDILCRMETQSAADPAVEKVFALSKRLSPKHSEVVVRKICTRLASNCAAIGNSAGATYWFTRANDAERAVAQAEASLTSAEIGGCHSAGAEALDRTAEAISVCDNAQIQEKLDYLRMYSELQASLINADEESSAARDAASSASALLGANGGLPEAHWGVVVYDCASILLPSAEASAEAKLIGIGKDETYSLLKALETVSASTGAHRDSLLEGLRQRNITADPEQLLSTVRLKLMRNLALCILSEN
uniref:Nuclear pore complex protein Nup85 n=1 Tax=Rhodosorus marinus TaxID=101924 RepID=A0A7S3EGJ5_9RHOD|mmetsp:Transcript_34581/g.136355  ORF Transcript_34581/g.136355 Transcript_34581/m.136355 type:complete len:587 (+) Transcript_34581:352-2112(+)